MFRNLILFAASVSILGFSIGCGGPGDISTVDRADRPAGLRDGEGTIDPQTGNQNPSGVERMD